MRTIVDLPTDQLDLLQELCVRERISRAEAVRRAVAEYVQRQALATSEEDAFGIWADRAGDALSDEARLRAEWDR